MYEGQIRILSHYSIKILPSCVKLKNSKQKPRRLAPLTSNVAWHVLAWKYMQIWMRFKRYGRWTTFTVLFVIFGLHSLLLYERDQLRYSQNIFCVTWDGINDDWTFIFSKPSLFKALVLLKISFQKSIYLLQSVTMDLILAVLKYWWFTRRSCEWKSLH